MSHNHSNVSWRALWTVDPVTKTAVHASGAVARVQCHPTHPLKDRVVVGNTDQVDLARWDVSLLTSEALVLWMDEVL